MTIKPDKQEVKANSCVSLVDHRGRLACVSVQYEMQ